MCHSASPKVFETVDHNPRITIGNKDCKHPYSASIFNVSAMSFGSLSARAVEAMNGGARIGGFAQNTGEGGISPYHLKVGGDLIYQIGSAYIGGRDEECRFSLASIARRTARPMRKMIDVQS